MKFDSKNQGDYLIMSAIRGPDPYTERLTPTENNSLIFLKVLTTGVLRHFIELGDTAYGPIKVSPEEAKLHWASLSRAEKKTVAKLWHTNVHFNSHICLAFGALEFKLDPENGYKESRDYYLWLIDQMKEYK
jgi:hypothetical protein